MNNDQTLEELLKRNKISQKTYDKVKIAKNYIEKKYNFQTIKNLEWNGIIEKINSLLIPEEEKERVKKEIYEKELTKYRKKREKQSIYNYESLSIIGRGAFGEVHVCRERKTGKIVAIKKIKKEVIELKNQIIHTRNEQLIMSKLKSKWIVELKESFQEGDYLYLVMEFVAGGDFMNLLIKKDILTEKEAKFYMAEIILAIESIHNSDCIHRDIKPDNILIDKNGHIKLSDFGLCKVSDKLYDNNNNNILIQNKFNNEKMSHKKNFSCVGTAFYVAPEVLNKNGYGKEIDWWSLGTIFFEMLCGYAPFYAKDTREVCHKILHWESYLEIPKRIKLSNEAVDLIKKLINYSNFRLGKNGAEEIKNHPFFKGINWNNILNMKPPFIPILNNDYDVKYFEHFDYIEPFYPPENKYKKRKNVEYLGYTFKNNDDELNIEDEFKIAIGGIDNLKNNISVETESTFSGSRIGNESLKKIILFKNNCDIIKDNSYEKKKSSSLKKIKIDCSLKSPLNNPLIDKNNVIYFKNYSLGKKNTFIKKVDISPSSNRNLLFTNTESNNNSYYKINKSKGKNNPIYLLTSKLNGNYKSINKIEKQ